MASDAPMNTRSFVPSGMRMVCGQESTQFSPVIDLRSSSARMAE